MPEQVEKRMSMSDVAATDALIAGKSISFYWAASKFFIFVFIILDIINIVFDIHPYGRWVISLFMVMLFTFWLSRRARVKLNTAMAANIFLGVVSGLILAVFDIIWYHQWWYVLDLIRLPVILGFIGLAISIIFYLLFRSILINHRQEASKSTLGSTHSPKR